MCLMDVLGKCVQAWGMRADLPFFVSVLQAQCIHGTHDGSQRLDGVAVNDRLVLLYIVARETVLVDDPKRTQMHTHISRWGQNNRFGISFVHRHRNNSPLHNP